MGTIAAAIPPRALWPLLLLCLVPWSGCAEKHYVPLKEMGCQTWCMQQNTRCIGSDPSVPDHSISCAEQKNDCMLSCSGARDR